MKRRDFLTLCGLATGSVIVPPPIARLIRDTSVLAGEPLVIATPRAKFSTIYAASDYGDYALHFGDPDAEPDLPSWRDFIDSRGVNLDCDEDRFDFLEQYFAWDRSSGEPEPDIPLVEEIDGGARAFYMEWDFEMHESPMALAYVRAPNLATLACLQHRLNELDENILIEIR